MASVMKDVCGNSLTCSSPEALKLYNQALGHFVSTRSIFLKPLQRAIELESGFTMARCLMVCRNNDDYNFWIFISVLRVLSCVIHLSETVLQVNDLILVKSTCICIRKCNKN